MATLDPSWLWVHVLVLARVAPVCAFATLLSRSLVPWPVGLSLALSLAVGLSGGVAAQAGLTGGLEATLWLVPRELCLGLAFGMAVLLPVLSLGWAARWVEHALPGASARSGPLAQLYTWLAALSFFAFAGHRAVVMGLSATLRDVPVAGGLTRAELVPAFVSFVADAFAFGLALALPLWAALWIAGAVVALVARALGVSGSLDAPIRLPLFVLLAALMMGPLVAQVPDAVRAGLAAGQSAVRNMGR